MTPIHPVSAAILRRSRGTGTRSASGRCAPGARGRARLRPALPGRRSGPEFFPERIPPAARKSREFGVVQPEERRPQDAREGGVIRRAHEEPEVVQEVVDLLCLEEPHPPRQQVGIPASSNDFSSAGRFVRSLRSTAHCPNAYGRRAASPPAISCNRRATRAHSSRTSAAVLPRARRERGASRRRRARRESRPTTISS